MFFGRKLSLGKILPHPYLKILNSVWSDLLQFSSLPFFEGAGRNLTNRNLLICIYWYFSPVTLYRHHLLSQTGFLWKECPMLSLLTCLCSFFTDVLWLWYRRDWHILIHFISMGFLFSPIISLSVSSTKPKGSSPSLPTWFHPRCNASLCLPLMALITSSPFPGNRAMNY